MSSAQQKTTFWVAVVVAAIALKSIYAADAPVLGFYFVSSEPKPGWRHFDSTAFPNLGYIADRPDLPVAHIMFTFKQPAELDESALGWI
jgi:hypothetical protein